VVIPSRLVIYPELLLDLPTMDGFAGMGNGTVRFLLALNAAGVETFDLRPAMAAARFGTDGDRKDQLFLRGDPHWTPRGAELSARAIGERVASLPWFVRGPLKEGKDFQLKRVTLAHFGDLAVAGGAIPEDLDATSVVGGSRPLGALSDNSRFVVVGDSFVHVYEWKGADLTTHLARFLGHKLALVTTDAGAIKESREKLALWSPADWKSRKLVIGCVTEQNLWCNPQWVKVPLFGS